MIYRPRRPNPKVSASAADQHPALDEILRVVGDVQHRQTVEENADEDRTGDRAEDFGRRVSRRRTR